jgi:hypothetical protein
MAMIEASQNGRSAPSSSSARHQVSVLVSHDALIRGHTLDGEICDVAGIPVPVSVVQDILDDAFLVRGGPTALDNLQLLCRYHHELKTATDRLFDPGPPPATKGPDPPDSG